MPRNLVRYQQAGELHFITFSCYRRLHPWDHAAGVLLYREAGGIAGLLDGDDYRPLPNPGTLLMAPDQKKWQDLRQVLLAT